MHRVFPSSCKKLGLITSQDTIDWWTKQNPEALKQFMKDQIDLSDAIDKLSKKDKRNLVEINKLNIKNNSICFL